ncbi:hypothetical protein [Cytophaga hutchinsonii]|uniref:Uncharacterized protein n=1 Tax=Cytophaga hutchinsonii (strain ATCC 33406 / DSM 1761 / CIP 103989 / NBRC 15051 / NCIMB 9469 / D465) TaxID=269798 RepID=A0A6N4SM54_CYTH3|nr:hypothetical protein [Cytophaga hutchinsonii]ABG57338.1 hypothetical protein CHU_0044 [Cytophaga hutchinsonii ATCC 33406]SFX46688.1 hypothetical protein SAMN04487930_104237 [Cytophaga hutchinsonii ATCC 33406]
MQSHKKYEKKYFQIRVIGQNDTGKSELKTLHLLAVDYAQAMSLARWHLHFEYQCFQAFLLQYRFLKIALFQYYSQLQGYEISRFHVIACLYVFKMDNRFDEDVSLLILAEARKLIVNYLRNKK